MYKFERRKMNLLATIVFFLNVSKVSSFSLLSQVG